MSSNNFELALFAGPAECRATDCKKYIKLLSNLLFILIIKLDFNLLKIFRN